MSSAKIWIIQNENLEWRWKVLLSFEVGANFQGLLANFPPDDEDMKNFCCCCFFFRSFSAEQEQKWSDLLLLIFLRLDVGWWWTMVVNEDLSSSSSRASTSRSASRISRTKVAGSGAAGELSEDVEENSNFWIVAKFRDDELSRLSANQWKSGSIRSAAWLRVWPQSYNCSTVAIG